MEPSIYSGLALLGPDLEPRPADVVVEAGRIVAIEERRRAPARWISPAFFNAHTHLGDTIAMDVSASGDLAALVRPPDGLKHRMLRAASANDCRNGIRASLKRMLRGGTTGCADFREGGARGIDLLREAARRLPCRVIGLGRDGGEAVADGAGIASARDVVDYLEVVARVRKRGGLVAFHAGERDPEDVDRALDCRPDLVVHMTHATDRQLRHCADEGIPIAVCPRSNWRLGVTHGMDRPPIGRMFDLGCRVVLGTDNAMFVSPDLAQEMMFASFVYRIDATRLLRAAVEGAAVIGSPCWIETGGRANFLVIDPARGGVNFSRDPVATLVQRLDSCMIETNVFNLKDESIKTIF